MSDEAWHFAASFFAWIDEQAPKQRDSLREVFVGWAAIRELCHADAVQSGMAFVALDHEFTAHASGGSGSGSGGGAQSLPRAT